MPEGDTVWLSGRRLHAALAGRTLTGSDFRVPQLAAADLTGAAVLGVMSRGKHLLTRFDTGRTLHTHLRMDGSWHLYRSARRWTGGPDWQVRVVLRTAEWDAVGYRLPVVELLPTAEEDRAVGHLGPDLLGPDWDPDRAVANLLREPDRAVGEALLDQRNLAGLGNLYRLELCFLRGVSPWTPVAAVPNLRAVVELGRRLLLANRDRPEQVTTGSLRRGEHHWVIGRANEPCRRCGRRIRRAEQGPPPRQRITYWCPRCQPGPAPAESAATAGRTGRAPGTRR
jgi:endonuclease-8